MVETACSILAAGFSQRFREDKLRQPLGGRPVFRWVAEAVEGLGLRHVSVVLRHQQRYLSALLPGAEVLVNNAPERGLSSSVRLAAEWAQSLAEGLLLTLADQPLVSTSSLRMLVKEFETGKWDIVSASLRGEPVNPALFSKKFFGELMALEGDVGARSVTLRHWGVARLVEFPEDELIDVDSPRDLELAKRAAARLGLL